MPISINLFRQKIGSFCPPGQSRHKNGLLRYQTKHLSLFKILILSFLLIHDAAHSDKSVLQSDNLKYQENSFMVSPYPTSCGQNSDLWFSSNSLIFDDWLSSPQSNIKNEEFRDMSSSPFKKRKPLSVNKIKLCSDLPSIPISNIDTYIPWSTMSLAWPYSV